MQIERISFPDPLIWQPGELDYPMQAADQAAPYVRKGVDTVGPYAKSAAGYAKQVAEPLINAATPIVQARSFDWAGDHLLFGLEHPKSQVERAFSGPDFSPHLTSIAANKGLKGTCALQNGIDEVQFFLNKQGINADSIAETTRSATSTAEQAITYATPKVGAAANKISTSTPQQIGQYGLALLGIYFLVSTFAHPVL